MRLHTELTVNLKNLEHNFSELKNLAPSNDVIFMVKANAYGHGLLEVVHFAYQNLGVKRFGCASLGEAIQIRKFFPKMGCELWVFSDSNLDDPRYKESYLDFNIVPVIHNLNDLKSILSDTEFKFLPLVLKFDTGMNRMGIKKSETQKAIELLKRNKRDRIEHLLTHFSSSYLKLKANDRTQRQYQDFLEIKKVFAENQIQINETSCANSGAIEQKFALDESHIRPGLMLYGPQSVYKGQDWKGKSISQFRTQVIKVTEIKKGQPVGYGAHVVGKDGHIIYLPVGYGDGILTYYSGIKFRSYGTDAMILGRVNMDLTAVFYEELPTCLKEGQEFSFWDDKEHCVTELAVKMKTTPYQLFTAITTRVPRRYHY